jgi:hypothetical protein
LINKTLMYYVPALLVVFSFLQLKRATTAEWTKVNDEYAHMHVLNVLLRYQLPVAHGGNERPGIGYRKGSLQGVFRDKSDSCQASGTIPTLADPLLDDNSLTNKKSDLQKTEVVQLASALVKSKREQDFDEEVQLAAALEESKLEQDFDGAVNQVALYNYMRCSTT